MSEWSMGPREHMREAFMGLSRKAQAVLGYTTLAGLYSERGEVPIAEIKAALSLTDREWEAVADELYEEVKGFRSGHQNEGGPDHFAAMLTSDVARFAVGAAGRPSSKDWNRIRRETFAYHFEMMDPHCLVCGGNDEPLAIDHVQPVSRGGSNHFHNLMPLCGTCNSSKGTKLWSEWIETTPRRRIK